MKAEWEPALGRSGIEHLTLGRVVMTIAPDGGGKFTVRSSIVNVSGLPMSKPSAKRHAVECAEGYARDILHALGMK